MVKDTLPRSASIAPRSASVIGAAQLSCILSDGMPSLPPGKDERNSDPRHEHNRFTLTFSITKPNDPRFHVTTVANIDGDLVLFSVYR
jgi:hypothetical protein